MGKLTGPPPGGTYRILVTGTRKTTAKQDDYVATVLYLAAQPSMTLGLPIVVVHGAAKGVDSAAASWAKDAMSVTPEPHPADWDRHGKKAGAIRNGEMVAAGAHICLAFPGPDSIGTWDCLKQAVGAGIHSRIYPLVAT